MYLIHKALGTFLTNLSRTRLSPEFVTWTWTDITQTTPHLPVKALRLHLHLYFTST